MWIDKGSDQDPYNRQGNNVNNPNNQPSVGAGGGSAPAAGGTSAPSGSNPSTFSPVQANKTQNFASVQDYLKGNQQQGEDLGNKVTGKLESDFNNEKSTIDQSAGNVKNQIKSATPTYDSNLTNEALNNPTAVTGDPNKLNSFLSQWNASYSGPSSFESTSEFGNAAGAKNEADARKAQVGSAGGQQSLLHDDFGVYGQGNQGLDQAVLQNSSKYGDVMGYGSKFAGVGDYLKGQSTDVNSQAASAQAAADQAKQNTQGAFSNSLTDFTTNLNNRVTQDQSQASTLVNKVKQDLASGDATKIQADLAKSNLTPQQQADIKGYLSSLNGTYGVNPDLTNYYTYNPATDISRSTVATKDDYAKAKALQQLTGTDYSGALNPTEASKANTWDNVQTGYQGASLQNYLKGSLGQQDKELLGHNNIADVSTKLKVPDITKNPGDANAGNKLADAIISAAKRTGTTADFGTGGVGHANNPVGQLIDSLNQQLTLAINNGDPMGRNGMLPGGANNPKIAGLSAAVNKLKQYFHY